MYLQQAQDQDEVPMVEHTTAMLVRARAQVLHTEGYTHRIQDLNLALAVWVEI